MQTDKRQVIRALIQLGQAHLADNNTPRALTSFEEGLTLSEEIGDQELSARLWGYKGMCLAQLGNSHFAEIALMKSLKMARAIDQKALHIDALTQLGKIQFDKGQTTKAVARWEQALGIAMSSTDRVRAMNLAGKLSDVFLKLESAEKALEYASLALDLAQKVGQRNAECLYLNNIGGAYLTDREVGSAIAYYERALDLASELEDPGAELYSMSNLMRAHILAGSRSLAVLYGEHAIRLAEKTGSQEAEIANLEMLTAFLITEQQFIKAEPYARRGLAIAEAKEDWHWQLRMLDHLGALLYDLRRLDEAQESTYRALRLAERLQDRLAEAQLLIRLSAIQAEQGFLSEAVDSGEKVLALGLELDQPRLAGEGQILLAFAHCDLDEINRAQVYCREAVKSFRKSGDARLLAKAESLLSELTG